MLPVNTSKNAEFHLVNAHSPSDRTLSSDSVVILPKNYSELLYHDYHRLTHNAQYRNSRTGGTRSTRTQIDHDVFEGLPVRHWRKKPINVSTAPEKENMNDMKARNLAWPELEMPRDYHLLSELSQNLLRAARMPQAKQSVIAPSMEDDKEAGDDEDADGDLDTGFTAKRWTVIPKDLEGPEPEFLAKRRKGLPFVHGGALSALGNTQQMRKTKIRKGDTSGGSSVLEVLVPEGQTVDGEIFEDEASPTQTPAPGTVVEGVGVVNADGVVIAGDQPISVSNRRRPPPPKRKPKGPGRGKKKKVAFAGADGKPTSIDFNHLPNGAIDMEGDRTVGEAQNAPNHGRALGDDSMLQEGEEGSEEGSDGEEGEEGDREEGELSPSPTPPTSPMKGTQAVATEPDIENEDLMPSGPTLPLESLPSITERAQTIVEPMVETAVEPSPELTFRLTDEPEDRMLLDKAIGEPTNNFRDGPMSELPAQPAIESMPDYAAGMVVDFTGQTVSEPAEQPPTELQRSMAGPIGEDSVEIGESSANEQQVDIHSEVLGKKTGGPVEDMWAENQAEPSTNPEASGLAAPEPEADTSIEPNMEQIQSPSIEVSMEPFTEPTTVSVAEPLQQPIPEPMPEAIVESVSQDPEDQTTTPILESIPQDLEEQPTEHISEPSPEPTKQATPPVMVETFPIPMVKPSDDSFSPLVEETRPEFVSNPIPPRPAEFFHEPPTESAERRFSFTRPAASPKAPTPSPPTPIEDKFALRAPYVSPKAPTMSPPTPLDRSKASSPDIPLAEQKFELPPPINAAAEGQPALVLDMQRIPDADRISVEAAPPVEPQLNAQIPVEHNPLEGMAEPKVADMSTSGTAPSEQPVLFSDGEEDLLGSLERSLDQRAHTS